MLLEFDLSADQVGLGSIPPITFISARSLIAAAFLIPSCTHAGSGFRPTQKPGSCSAAADDQLDHPVSDDHLGAAICAGIERGGAGLDDADLCLPHHLGHTRHEPATLLKLVGAMLGLAGTAAIIGLDALGGLSKDIFAEIVILLATVSFACATIFGMRLTEYDPMVVAAGSLVFGGCVLLPASLIIDHPWTLRPTAEALAATVAMGIFSSAFGLMLFYMCLSRLGTLTTNAQGYLRIPIGVGLSVLLLGETVPANLALGLVLVMAGVAAMTIPGDRYGKWINRLRGRVAEAGRLSTASSPASYRRTTIAAKRNP